MENAVFLLIKKILLNDTCQILLQAQPQSNYIKACMDQFWVVVSPKLLV